MFLLNCTLRTFPFLGSRFKTVYRWNEALCMSSQQLAWRRMVALDCYRLAVSLDSPLQTRFTFTDICQTFTKSYVCLAERVLQFQTVHQLGCQTQTIDHGVFIVVGVNMTFPSTPGRIYLDILWCLPSSWALISFLFLIKKEYGRDQKNVPLYRISLSLSLCVLISVWFVFPPISVRHILGSDLASSLTFIFTSYDSILLINSPERLI